jgi:hypothetical protein
MMRRRAVRGQSRLLWVWRRVSFHNVVSACALRLERFRTPTSRSVWLAAECAMPPKACKKPQENEKSRIGIKTLVLWQLELLCNAVISLTPLSTDWKVERQEENGPPSLLTCHHAARATQVSGRSLSGRRYTGTCRVVGLGGGRGCAYAVHGLSYRRALC